MSFKDRIATKINLPLKKIATTAKTEDNRLAKMTPEEKRRLEREEEKRKERELKKELREKYITLEEASNEIIAAELIGDLKEIKSQSTSPEIYDIIKQILARKAAIEWKITGTTRIPSMIEIISPEEMLAEDFPKLVGSEFEHIRQIEKQQGQKGEYQYTEEDLQNLILRQIAKKVAGIYNRVEILDIPEMKQLTEEQEELFINEMNKYTKESINEKKVRNQIRGVQGNELGELKELVEKIPEDEREYYIKRLKLQIQRGKQKHLPLDLQTELESLGEELKELEPEEAMEILKDMRKKIKSERRVEESQQEVEGSTQSDDENMH